MSARLGPHFSHKRTLTARFAVAGVAALAAVVGTAPMAVADGDIAAADNGTTETIDPAPADPAPVDPTPTDETPTDETPTDETPTDETPSDETPSDETPTDETPTDETTAETAVDQPEQDAKSVDAVEAAVVADFGYTKFRVGVQLDTGSYVPAGTTTLGSTIKIVETGPGVPGGTMTTTCTTSTAPTGPSGATFCENLSPGSPFDSSDYSAALGDVVTVTQTGVNAKLVIFDGTKTVVPACDSENPIDCIFNEGDVLLTDAGLPPKAVDDKATTDAGVPVTVKILSNDDTVNGAPLTGIKVTNAPNHGKVKITGSGDARRIKYTPDSGFSGTDHFDYRITTPNGTATATVTIKVAPAATLMLPDTGGSNLQLLALSLAMIGSGGWLIGQGRQPRRRTDAFV